jgi:hypothetical protein
VRLPRRRPSLEVAPGETTLASAMTADGRPVCGTRDALYLPFRIPWEHVETADWDSESSTLRVLETDAEPFALVLEDDEPRRLLQLIRERVTASVVLQRHVPVAGKRGLRVVARRAPGHRGDLIWHLRYDAGVDPESPQVRRLAAEALAAARGDVGLG